MIGYEPRIWQLDVSVDDYDSYESSDQVRLHMVRSSDDYLDKIKQQLGEIALHWPRFDLCLYNAGMDPFEGCADGALAGITREMLATRERIVFDWCRQQSLPVAFSLAGGYIGEKLDQQGLVDLHRLTLSAAARADLPPNGRHA